MRWLTGLLLASAVVGLAGFAWSYHHQRALSAEVKAAVLATLGDNTNYADATAYVRAAKLACRTRRDFEVVGRLDKLVTLANAAQEDDRLSWKLVMDNLRAAGDQSWRLCKFNHSMAFCRLQLQQESDELKRNQELEKSYSESSKVEAKQARALLVQLRADMNLPPLPEQKQAQ
jgi:hypothetical protein